MAIAHADPPDLPASGRADSARRADAMIERGVLSTHAETPGSGAETLSVHEGLLVSIGHAFTDDLQLTGGGLLPAWGGAPWAAFAQGKLVIARTDATTVALRGTGGLVAQRGGEGIAVSLGGGLLVDAYPPPRWLSLHGGLSLQGARGTPISRLIPFDGDLGLGVLELGASARTSQRTALLAEIWLPITWDEGDVQAFPMVLAPWIFRWGGPRLALDVGFLSGTGAVFGESPFAVGWPYLALGGRLPEPG